MLYHVITHKNIILVSLIRRYLIYKAGKIFNAFSRFEGRKAFELSRKKKIGAQLPVKRCRQKQNIKRKTGKNRVKKISELNKKLQGKIKSMDNWLWTSVIFRNLSKWQKRPMKIMWNLVSSKKLAKLSKNKRKVAILNRHGHTHFFRHWLKRLKLIRKNLFHHQGGVDRQL